MDLSLSLAGTHVLITGGSGYIGSVTVSAFLTAGALVSSLDLKPSPLPTHENLQCITCDISVEEDIERAFKEASMTFGVVKCCVALAGLDLSVASALRPPEHTCCQTARLCTPLYANKPKVLPHHASLADIPVSQWQQTHTTNVTGTFLTARTWLRQLRSFVQAFSKPADDLTKCTFTNVGLIIVGSESGRLGEMTNADYAAGKSAVQGGLVASLAADVVRVWKRGRVNAVAPGAVDTEAFRRECKANPDQLWLDSQAT
jgi:NAD(P)-dependent dehydrogenase (short-subunit alcohol dehydrogenase family)